MNRTQRQVIVSTRLGKIAEVARNHPGEALTTLSHHIDVELLYEAWRRTRKNGAVGIDGQTAAEYKQDLYENLKALCDRFHQGTYRAPAVRRVHIPKGKGKTRPIGIPTLEDKILQRAVAMVLDAVYEQDFEDCSYGFRPERSAHDALTQVRDSLMSMKGGYVIDMDISAFFDSLSHAKLREFLDHRVRDGVIRRMIDKWLKAGISEDGKLRFPEEGTPQGGVVSPILANVFLHHVLDKWFVDDVQPRMCGRTTLTRFADDAIIICEREDDLQRIMQVLSKRFARFNLKLHPDKTKVIAFQRPPYRKPQEGDEPDDRPDTFNFLGFTHFWARSRRGYWVVKQKTMSSRLSRGIVSIGEWCRDHRHRPITEQHRMLKRKLRGHYNYYGIIGNFRSIEDYYHQVKRLWQKWLNRRAQGRHMPWDKFNLLLRRYPLPLPRIMHEAQT